MEAFVKNMLFMVLGAVLAVGGMALLTPAPVPPASQPVQPFHSDVLALQSQFRELSDRLAPAVVAVVTRRGGAPENLLGGEIEGSGTGFAFAPGGLILTNEHVVHGAERIEVILSDGRHLPATMIGGDVRSDLAVLRVEAEVPYLEVCEVCDVKPGDWVAAVGNPLGLANADGRPVFSVGLVGRSGVSLPGLGQSDDRHYSNMIQTSAPLLPGSSGGPLVNLQGRVVGVNAAIRRPVVAHLPSSPMSLDNMGFAIPFTPRTLAIIDKLRQGEPIRYGYLGVQPGGVAKDGQGVIRGVAVEYVEPDSPADRAGIHVGDVITHFNGAPIQNADDLIRLIGAGVVGESSRVDLVRSGRSQSLTVLLADRRVELNRRSPNGYVDWRGLRVENFLPQGGALVTGVAPGSPAQEAGLHAGDLIVRAAGRPVYSAEQFGRTIADLQGPVEIQLRSGRELIIEP